MIFLKTKTKQIVILYLVIALCFVSFLALGVFYIAISSKSYIKTTDTNLSRIPYSSLPAKMEIYTTFPSGTTALISLDFSNELTDIELEPENPDYGYTLKLSEDALSGFIDRLGGVEIVKDNIIMRYTGMQVIDLCQSGYTDISSAIAAVFTKIADIGITRQTLTYLIEHSQTDISAADCFSLPEWLESSSKSVTVWRN